MRDAKIIITDDKSTAAVEVFYTSRPHTKVLELDSNGGDPVSVVAAFWGSITKKNPTVENIAKDMSKKLSYAQFTNLINKPFNRNVLSLTYVNIGASYVYIINTNKKTFDVYGDFTKKGTPVDLIKNNKPTVFNKDTKHEAVLSRLLENIDTLPEKQVSGYIIYKQSLKILIKELIDKQGYKINETINPLKDVSIHKIDEEEDKLTFTVSRNDNKGIKNKWIIDVKNMLGSTHSPKDAEKTINAALALFKKLIKSEEKEIQEVMERSKEWDDIREEIIKENDDKNEKGEK